MASLFNKLRDLIMQSHKEKSFSSTVEIAVNKIMSGLPIGERTKIANMDERKLVEFHLTYGIFIKNKFRLWTNSPLKKSCCEVSGLQIVNPDQASFIILKELQKRIKEMDVRSVVK